MVITIYLIKVIARIEILKIHWILKKKEHFLFYLYFKTSFLYFLKKGIRLEIYRPISDNPIQSWILDSAPWIPDSQVVDSRFFVSGTWISDSNR